MFKIAWQHIRRSPYQAVAAVLIMTLTFFVASLFFLVLAGSYNVLSYFEKKPQITVFFTDKKTQSEIKDLEERLRVTGQVSSLKYVSKEEALAIYREQNKADPLLLEMVTADILPSSLEISAVSAEYLSELAKILKNEKETEEVVYQKDIIDSLLSWTKGIRTVGIILVSFLSLLSLLLILTIISMKIAFKKEEIEILKLIGASPWYIRMPFILEGSFYGLIGAVLAWLASFGLLLYSTPFLSSFLAQIPILPVPLPFMLAVFSGMVFLGAALGSLGSLLALKRYS